jgi:hypothetical protein
MDGDGRITRADVVLWNTLWRRIKPRPPYQYTVATFNLWNLFDTVDDPDTDDPVSSTFSYERQLGKLAAAIHDDLREPTLLGVQEAENMTVLEDLAAQPEIVAEYASILVDGPDGRGIDVGLMYRVDQVIVRGYEARQGCTTLVDGFGPDGNYNGEIEYTLPRRVQQAEFVAGLVAEIEGADPKAAVVVLGDLNDFLDSDPVAALLGAGMKDLLFGVPKPSRYTYIYLGVSEVLDHILINPALLDRIRRVEPVHINADYPSIFDYEPGTSRRSSDHDAVMGRFKILRVNAY